MWTNHIYFLSWGREEILSPICSGLLIFYYFVNFQHSRMERLWRILNLNRSGGVVFDVEIILILLLLLLLLPFSNSSSTILLLFSSSSNSSSSSSSTNNNDNNNVLYFSRSQGPCDVWCAPPFLAPNSSGDMDVGRLRSTTKYTKF